MTLFYILCNFIIDTIVTNDLVISTYSYYNISTCNFTLKSRASISGEIVTVLITRIIHQ